MHYSIRKYFYYYFQNHHVSVGLSHGPFYIEPNLLILDTRRGQGSSL